MADSFPRRRKDDDPTATPVFLVQRRRFTVTVDGASYLHWYSDDETLRDGDGKPYTEEQAVAQGWGRWEWDTTRVAFTRKEADDYCQRRSYDGPFRSYSVPALGDLRVILDALTDPDHALEATAPGKIGDP